METFILPNWAPAISLLIAALLQGLLIARSKDYTLIPVTASLFWCSLVYLLEIFGAITNTERMAMVRGSVFILGVALAVRAGLKLAGPKLWAYLSQRGCRHGSD